MKLTRRTLIAGAAAAAVPGSAHAGRPRFTVHTVATDVAVRSDQRAMAGGVYDPAAGQTFICWIGQNSHPTVAAYDHRRRLWSAPVVAGTSPFGDAHNYPAMVQADDGRLLVFHGSHNSVQKLTVSEPHTIDGAWTDQVLPQAPRSSYPMPVKAANGDIYLFYRDTPHLDDRTKFTDDRPIHYLLSTDDGRTWTHSRDLTGGAPYVIGSTGRPDNHNEVYIGEITASGGRFHLVWTIAGGGPGVHDHDRYHRNLYYAAFQPSDRHFYSVTGADLGPAIDGDAMESHTKVLHTELQRAKPLTRDIGYTHLVGVMAGGRPVLPFHRQDGDTTVVNVARWTGRTWQVESVHREGTLLEMERLTPNRFRVYTKAPEGVATFRLDKHWRSEAVVPTPTAIQRAAVIPNHREPARVVLTGQTSTANQQLADGDVFVLGVPSGGRGA